MRQSQTKYQMTLMVCAIRRDEVVVAQIGADLLSANWSAVFLSAVVM
jgi:hypothetical protein